jgi:hypothetical protein
LLNDWPIKAVLESRMIEHQEPPISVVRQKVLAVFREMGVGDGGCTEAVLIKDGLFTGRRFRLGGFVAMWLVGECHISVFNEEGDMIASQPLDDAELKKAA